MRKLSVIITALFLTTTVVPAAFCQKEKPALDSRHSVRIGWGDMLSETMLFRPSVSGTWANPGALPADYTRHDIDNTPITLSGKVLLPAKGKIKSMVIVSHWTIGANRE